MTFVCVPGWIYLTTVFYQDHQHLTPLQNAIRLIPSCVSGTLASVSTCSWVLRWFSLLTAARYLPPATSQC